MNKFLVLICIFLFFLGGTPSFASIMGQVGSLGFSSITYSEDFEDASIPMFPGQSFSTSNGFNFGLTPTTFIPAPKFVIYDPSVHTGNVGFPTKSLYQNGGAPSMDMISLTNGTYIRQIQFDVSNGYYNINNPQNIWVRTYNNGVLTGYDFDFNAAATATIAIWSDGITLFDEIRIQSYYWSTIILHDEGQRGAISIDNIVVGVGGRAPVPEPATVFLFGLGLLGLSGINRRNK
ncbi:MAG: PEP-CTERM sorting domain-containing protein [Proteobacteria bacterium]|nr:PEP-CTERM sorting domain-containing protein [Pseudomonadota bacterium]MBU1585417.1 PEP-CTERM sorting domain-containing protein [Pseudomonadota bacterium]MBU2455461.1 PEP-CTERM sorting domain-containing protein [Pseudomonadota bacterium]MBU2627470.1 PEP-CTERM sorting domain-containing protein [Pseudomonadota bacterium]